MNRKKPLAVLTDSLADHPAVRAWAAATGRVAEPELVRVFRERPACAMYWIPGLGAGGAPVFAKRSLAELTRIERTVYEELLPELPLTVPRYYGAVVNGRYGWIFLEDVGRDRYRQAEPEHREVAARWLATMHTAGAKLPAARSLPDAGPARYLEHLHGARKRILASVRAFSFSPSEASVLNTIASYCDAIEERWARVEAACRGAPSTFVHCDFQPKNAFLTSDASGLNLWLIDWEEAGFGAPAPDLPRLDLKAYWHTVRPEWPDTAFETVERLARAGRMFQLLAAISWESLSLASRRPLARSDAIIDLDYYMPRLAKAARSLGALE